jgi:hypothetical protein
MFSSIEAECGVQTGMQSLSGLGIFTPEYWHETPAIYSGRLASVTKIQINSEPYKEFASLGGLTGKSVHLLETHYLRCQFVKYKAWTTITNEH